MKQTLIDRIELALFADRKDRVKFSRYLEIYYQTATEQEKTRIDLCFLALCGLRLRVLIKRERQAQGKQATLIT